MKPYLKTDIIQHDYQDAFTKYLRLDAGRFDACQTCPLKIAVLNQRKKVA